MISPDFLQDWPFGKCPAVLLCLRFDCALLTDVFFFLFQWAFPGFFLLSTSAIKPVYDDISWFPVRSTLWETSRLRSTFCNCSLLTDIPSPSFIIQNFADDWIRTADLWHRKRPLYQLSHNHFPLLNLYLLILAIVPPKVLLLHSFNFKRFLIWHSPLIDIIVVQFLCKNCSKERIKLLLVT